MQTSIARDKGIMKTDRINYDLLFMSAAYINHKFVAGELTNEVVKRSVLSTRSPCLKTKCLVLYPALKLQRHVMPTSLDATAIQ